MVRFGSFARVMSVVVALGAGTLGCMTGMDGEDQAGMRDVQSGISQGRQGLDVTRGGLLQFKRGERQTGLQEIDRGMTMMSSGMGRMHGGHDQMPSDMMEQCGCGDAETMGPMHDAMEDVQAGRAMMMDEDAANDDAACDRMAQGLDAMEAGYRQADAAMSCMGGGGDGMMGGGMM